MTPAPLAGTGAIEISAAQAAEASYTGAGVAPDVVTVGTRDLPSPPPRMSGPAVESGPPPTEPAAREGADEPHVLLVDDDGTTRQIARGVLEAAGYRVAEACDGSEALVRLAHGEHFNLMLLDLQMPMLGGREVLRSVRQNMATVGLPVVVLTGSQDHGTEIELMEMGADDYLRKPIDPPLLAIRVKAAMRRALG